MQSRSTASQLSNLPMTEDLLYGEIPSRHSVRNYTDRKVEGDVRERLGAFIEACNAESGLSLQLVTDEPSAFSGMMASYGKFTNVRNYIACVGPKGDALQENVGYWGELAVLAAQALGLNTCWVGATYSKRKVGAKVERGEKLAAVIALGYGTTEGRPRKSKSIADATQVTGEAPQWFNGCVEAALLAPTSMNQQKFRIVYDEGEVRIENLGGIFSKVDLGIVRAHFDLARTAIE